MVTPWRAKCGSGVWLVLALASTPLFANLAPGLPAPKAEHVVLMVWDGMRPDFVSEANTPHL